MSMCPQTTWLSCSMTPVSSLPRILHWAICISWLTRRLAFVCAALDRVTDSAGTHRTAPHRIALVVCICPGADLNGAGRIKDQFWYGEDGMQHVRTKKEPKQAIPTFAETVELLMKVCCAYSYPCADIHSIEVLTVPCARSQPENMHVKFNVDVKADNNPARLFALMHAIISAHADYETLLAPRILLGLWHPRFIGHAKETLPYCRRSYIGNSPYIARKYFWKDCDAFSISFGALTTADGQRWVVITFAGGVVDVYVLAFLFRFRSECKNEGKNLMVWTVNEPDHMMEVRVCFST